MGVKRILPPFRASHTRWTGSTSRPSIGHVHHLLASSRGCAAAHDGARRVACHRHPQPPTGLRARALHDTAWLVPQTYAREARRGGFTQVVAVAAVWQRTVACPRSATSRGPAASARARALHDTTWLVPHRYASEARRGGFTQVSAMAAVSQRTVAQPRGEQSRCPGHGSGAFTTSARTAHGRQRAVRSSAAVASDASFRARNAHVAALRGTVQYGSA